MKFILFNCVLAIFLLSSVCLASDGVASEEQILKGRSFVVSKNKDKDKEQAEAKLALLEQMFETRDASEVKSNFGKGIVVAGYEEPMASMIIDAAAEQSPTISKMEIIEIIKRGSKLKVVIQIEGDGISEGDKYFVLNKNFEFIELNLFSADTK